MSEPRPDGENTMTPSRFQVPPHPDGASAIVSGALPEISIVFSLLSAKKPTAWPSGDQNGYDALSVRASVTPSSRASDRTQSLWTSPSTTRASALPSL